MTEAKGRMLIVDDELSVRDSLDKWFKEEGYEVGTAESASEALLRLAEKQWDIALLDIKMRGTDGIELQRRMHEINPRMIAIMMTGYASVETAVAAMKNGAYDYVTKPLDPEDITLKVSKALSHQRTEQENERLREQHEEITRPNELVGNSAPMRRLMESIETVGPTDTSVLITGESGTGKELVARAIHYASPRRYHPLVVIHCGALTETLLESELFGHEKGAFTGAQYRKKGKFEVAEGGTVFLDEIGDISLKTQTDLLRVLQEHEIARVGGNQQIKVDFRCIAATNKPLEQLVEEGRFRPDLFYRLNVFRIELPALRERREDIPLLADHFIHKFSKEMNKRIVRIAPAAMFLLQQHNWPGNIRELENAIERAMVVAQEPELREQDFMLKAKGAGAMTNGFESRSLDDIEKTHILRVLEECGGNQTRAAEILDIDRVTLHHKLKKYGWSKERDVSQRDAMKFLQLVPIGAPEFELLDWLRRELSEGFQIPCGVEAPLDPAFAFHSERGQYHSSELLAMLHQKYMKKKTWRLLGVADVDLYIPILTFVFGEAQIGGPSSVVSYHRLRQEFYGLPPDRDLLARRLLTEAVHELGHTLHLTHCQDYECVMASSHAVEWIDLKRWTFCRDCAVKAQVHAHY